MEDEPFSEESLYAALVARDPSYEGRAYVGVTSTGIFCRFTCQARKPKRASCQFFYSIEACEMAGFRPCLRCRPREALGEAHPIVATLMQRLAADPERRWTETNIKALDLDPSTVRRVFKEQLGVTFLDFARSTRLQLAGEALGRGERVINAQVTAGFESASGFRSAFARVLGHSPSDLRHNAILKADWIASPLGPLLVIADHRAIHLLEFFDRKSLPSELRKLEAAAKGSIGLGRTEPIEQLAIELSEYFSGCRRRFTVALQLNANAFTRHVWTALLEIPAGETRSYADVARAIGRPSAVRAVARANGANQISILVPCHRVIGSDGELTGYGGGLWRKRRLLDLERQLRA